jgi:membrane peptidoglycan carboxypeptidase
MEITNEFIEKVIQRELDEMDLQGMAREAIRDEVRRNITSVAKDLVSVEIKGIIVAEVTRFLAEPIEVNDGWGKKEVWDSFEQMFRQEFRKQMDQKYEVKREIDKQVAARVKSLMDQKYQEVITKIVDSISATRLADPPKPPAP